MKFVKLLSVFICALLFARNSQAQINPPPWVGQYTGILNYSWGDTTGGGYIFLGGAPVITRDCAGLSISFYIIYVSSKTISLDFGDGTPPTVQQFQNVGNGVGQAVFSHQYQQPGNYTLTKITYDNGIPVDTSQSVYHHEFCSTMTVKLYNDVDGDCVYDNGSEGTLKQPILVEVDSANIPIDTLSCLGQLVYTAYGNSSTVYKFKIVTFPTGFLPSCPGNEIVIDTFAVGVKPVKYTGFQCPGNTFDLTAAIDSRAGSHAFESEIYVSNLSCIAPNATLTMNYDITYDDVESWPAPFYQSPGVLQWDLGSLTSGNIQHIKVELDGGSFSTGSPVSTTYELTPVTADLVPGNNTIVVIDTVTGGWDPNAIYVNPEGCVTAGTELEYTITFENLGNGPAEDIYVLDTIPAGLDVSSMRMQFASHDMSVEKIYTGNQVIFKFNFQDIMLPDSSSPDRHGMLKYKIKTNSNLPFGTNMYHRAGIYFDFNPPVLTNTANSGICWPASVNEVATSANNISIYPNPATDELTIKTEQVYSSYTITNSIGQMMMSSDMNSKESKVNIKSLATGIYYLSLEGQGGTEVRKFVKL
jgi:uncharacterized repeat protein (TIGR01451 family)